MIPLVSVVTFLPGAAGLALLFVPRRSVGVLRVASLAITVVTFVLSLPLYFGFDGDITGYQFEENRPWMPTLGAAYHVGIDGISLLLVLLTTFLMPLALASAWGLIEDRLKEVMATMLSLETGMLADFVITASFRTWGRADSCAFVCRSFQTRAWRSGRWCGRSR